MTRWSPLAASISLTKTQARLSERGRPHEHGNQSCQERGENAGISAQAVCRSQASALRHRADRSPDRVPLLFPEPHAYLGHDGQNPGTRDGAVRLCHDALLDAVADLLPQRVPAPQKAGDRNGRPDAADVCRHHLLRPVLFQPDHDRADPRGKSDQAGRLHDLHRPGL